MALFDVLMISTLIVSVFFCALVISRVLRYNRRYHFPEIKYTKLFRFITKEHITFLYVTFVAVHFIFAIWFIWTI